MSSTAIKTAFGALFIVLVVYAYGHGYKSGRSAQISMESAIEIAKAQFTCKMENK